MTLEERLNELETAIQSIRRDIQKPKRNVEDAVWVAGKIIEVDGKDENLPYLVATQRGETCWCCESDLQPKAP